MRLCAQRSSNERVRADKCFGSISPSPPPPPPVNRAGLAALKAALLQRQVRRGGSSGPTAAHAVTNEEEYATESEKHTASQLSYLDALAEDNVQLRGVLDGIRATVHAAGRRLWQRTDDAPSHALVDNILQTAAFGADPIIGITAAECEALCAALDGAAASACQGIAFARATANPRDLALRQCILLKVRFTHNSSSRLFCTSSVRGNRRLAISPFPVRRTSAAARPPRSRAPCSRGEILM